MSIDLKFLNEQCVYNERKVKILSWGGGSQSSAILQLYLDGIIDLDYIIFADTGLEPTYIYRQINNWLKEPKIKKIFHRVSAKNNMKHMIENYINNKRKSLRMFIYTYNKTTNHYGTHPKSCTGSYKISPNQSKVKKLIRQKYNLSSKESINNIIQEIYIGYSSDEKRRINKMNKYSSKNVIYRFPLNELNLSYIDVIKYLKDNNRTTYRSACFMCPFRNDFVQGMGWVDVLRDDYPNFVRALEYDVKIRNCDWSKKHFKDYNLYMDGSCVPLWYIYQEQISDRKLLEELWKQDDKGISDLKHKNRKFKQPLQVKCNESIIGECSL